MQRGSQDALSSPAGELSPQAVSPQINGINNDASSSTSDDRTGLVHPTVDVTEILRRWTHALQRIHKQSLYLVCSMGLYIFFCASKDKDASVWCSGIGTD